MKTTNVAPTLLTTARDFSAVAAVSVLSAIVLFAFVERAHAGGTPHPNGEYGYEYGPPPTRHEAWAACRPDVRAFCPNIVPGGGRILSCLAGNKDRLSYPCRDALLRAWAAYRR